VQNSVVAGNTLFSFPGGGSDCSGDIWSLGNNLIGDASGCGIGLQPTDLTGDPNLGALVGGGEDDPPGAAHYPVLAGSVVIDGGNPGACPSIDQLGSARFGTCDIGAVEFQSLPAELLVSIDIIPSRKSNKINLKSTKLINVVVFSDDGFDADSVDVATVRFGATGVEAAPDRTVRKRVNKDRRRDLLLRFEVEQTGITCGDTSAVMTGQTFAGAPFTASGAIITTGCN
jgi:hypothetical protein